VIAISIVVEVVLIALFRVTPEAPLEPTGQTPGLVLHLLAGAVVAPIGEEVVFRGLATTAWVRSLGARRGILQAAIFFALAHVIGVTGTSAGQAVALAIVSFASRLPVAIVLGWVFVRRGSIWASIGLHAAFNAILLLLGEVAIRAA
jgi:membrane protease YdiL (CAAX protease family)